MASLLWSGVMSNYALMRIPFHSANRLRVLAYTAHCPHHLIQEPTHPNKVYPPATQYCQNRSGLFSAVPESSPPPKETLPPSESSSCSSSLAVASTCVAQAAFWLLLLLSLLLLLMLGGRGSMSQGLRRSVSLLSPHSTK